MEKIKNRKNKVVILASLLIFALAISMAYFTDYRGFAHKSDAETLGFDILSTEEDSLSLMAPGDARYFKYLFENVEGLAIDMRAKIEIEDLSSISSSLGGFAVYERSDVLSYSYEEGYTLRAGATPILTSLDSNDEAYISLGVLHGLNDKPHVHAEGLIISGYVEGTGNNKALELYNLYNVPIDLSEYDIDFYFNGSTTSNGGIHNLSGILQPGESFLIVHTGAIQTLKDMANFITTSNMFTGNDAIVLRRGSQIADNFGVIGEDPGSGGWDGLTENHTLMRREWVGKGEKNLYTQFVPTLDWVQFGVDDFSYLGKRTGISNDSTWMIDGLELVVVLDEKSGNEWQGAEANIHFTLEGRQYKNAVDPNGKGGW